MNKREHVLNAVTVGGVALLLLRPGTVQEAAGFLATVVAFGLLPDVDTTLGRHRKTTHNVWILLGLSIWMVTSVSLVPVGAVLGYTTHILCDAYGSHNRVNVGWPVTDWWLGVKGHDPREVASPTTIAVVGGVLVGVVVTPLVGVVL